jgi:ABC-type Zn uptake system ZnuABC Zn-binding protein ZnuA/ABC-type Mn2+/Zn2+ transport system permease subunit
MLEPFQLPFVQRGVVEILVLALGAGVIGTWIVLRGLAFYSHAVGTAAFPGLVLADGIGFSATLGAAATGLLVALGVGALARREGAADRYDSLTALVLVGALASGVILASDVFRSGANIETLLFGSLLLVDTGDIAFAAVASGAALAGAWLFHTRWLISGFDPRTAAALGARSAVPDAVLLGLVALLAVAALATLGALLATAVLVVPAATTRLLFDRLRVWQAATVALVAVEGVAGLWLSVQTNAPPGGAIAVLSGGVFVVVALGRAAGRRRGGRRAAPVLAALTVLGLGAAGCGSASDAGTTTNADGTPAIKVIATTTQLGDIVREVGGDSVRLTQILKPNTDPHDYEPRPRDVVETAGAKVVFLSGDNLDPWMGDVVRQSGGSPEVVDLARSVPRRLPGEKDGPQASASDPHWWHDPRNVEAAVLKIRDTLAAAEPRATAKIDAGAEAYLAKVRALDRGIAACLQAVPAARRKLVTDHDAFGYFARRYGITVIGAVIPSQTTQAQPSAGDISALASVIRAQGVKAVFPESSVNAKLAQAIARQTGASASLTLYGDTLGPAGSDGATYLGMERANADAMAKGFTGGARGCDIQGP